MTTVNPHDEELLAELLVEWEELYERGQEVPAGELCKEHPHLAEELARRIAAMKATDWLNNPDPPAGDPPAVAVQPFQGRVLAGRYRLDDLIAEGGFAQVWRAYDTELQRIVAVKVPKPGRLESSENFMAEARRVARLKHPGIVPVYDVGIENDQCFIVSEFVEGGSLAEQVTRQKPSQAQVISWMCEVAAALEYAHLHGVIHRDIKPANILIDHHGRALLADFGIAQSAQKTGVFAPSLGTLRYMSPEQLEGKPATPQSDIYSLGVVLHECLTGKLPYTATDPTGLRREIIAGAPRGPGTRLPPHITAVCDTALSRSPEKRHTSAAHFAAALRRAGDEPANSIRRLVALWILSFGSLVGVGWYAWHLSTVPGRNADTPVSEVTVPTKPPAPLPDGTKAVVVIRFDKYLGRDFTPLLVEKGVRVASNVWSLEDLDLTGVRCVLITAASYDPEHRPTDREVAILERFVRDGGVCLLCGLTWHIKESVSQHPLNLFSRDIGIYFGGHVRRPQAVPGGPLDGISFDMPTSYNPSAITVSNPDAHVLGREHGTSGAASVVAVPYGKGTFIGIGHHVLLYNRRMLERLVAAYMPDLFQQSAKQVVTAGVDKFIFLSDLPERDIVAHLKLPFGKNGQRGYHNLSIRVNGVFAEKGISTHCETGVPVGVTYDVPPEARRFVAVAAIADDVVTQVSKSPECGSPITFRVLGDDGVELWKSPRPVKQVGELVTCDIPVDGTRTIRLEASCERSDSWCCAVWLNPCFVLDDSEVPQALRPWYADALGIPGSATTHPSRRVLANTIGIEMRFVPEGTFMMGSDDTDPSEQPVHEVRITRPFYIGVYEITNAQWKKVMVNVPSEWKDDDKPVEQISWHQAVSFCQKLSDLPAEKAQGRVYRLPTEAEWEYACRAGSKSLYSFGDDVSEMGEYAWLATNSGLQAQPVGRKKPNAWGLFDTHGNVWEWCHDRYGSYEPGPVTDPTGPEEGLERVSRGNGWGCTADASCASSRRGRNDPSTRQPYLGLRVVMTTASDHSQQPHSP